MVTRRSPVGLCLACAVAALGTANCSAATSPGDDGGLLLITSGFTDEVWVVDATTGDPLVGHSLDVRRGESDEPHGVAVAPDGNHWYATVAHGAPTLWKFDATDDRLVGRLELPTHGASRIGIGPAGRRGWIPDYWRSGEGADGQVAAVDLVTLEIVATPTVCPAPHDAQVDPSGTLVAVTCAFSDEIVFLNARSAEEVSRVSLEGSSSIAGTPVLRPMNVVWHPDGSALYVTLMGTNEVASLGRQGQERGRVDVGANPAQLAITSAGQALVVANRGGTSASVLELLPDGSLGDERSRVDLGDAAHPHGVAVNGSSSVAFVTFEGTTTSPGGVVAFDVDSGQVRWRSEVGAFTLGVAWMQRPLRSPR